MRSLPCLIALSAGLIATPALAQLLPSSASGISGGAPKAPRVARTSTPPPVAVPGARPRADSVAPASPGAADLPPTEALFDSINRGDILTARDAIARGADLDGTNLLGLTPLELSVDLGRNDISFLLLSLRGASGSASARAGGPAEPAAPLTAAQRRLAAARARAQAQPRAQPASARREPAARAPQAPALFAGNGGSAVPSAGFLGFDPHR